MNSIIGFFIRNRLFGDMLSLSIVVFGVASLFLIRREAFPNVQFDILTVTTVSPGASAEEMEKLVTNPIEQDLQEVDGIKKLQSISVEGRSTLIIQLDPDQTTEAEAKDDVKSVVDQVSLPENAEDPKVTALETKQEPIIQVSLSSEIPEMELRAIAKQLEKKIEAIPGVARVAYNGLRDLEIRVDVDPRKLLANRVSLDEVVQALKAQNNSISAGTLDPDPAAPVKAEKIVRTIGEFKDAADVADTVIRANEIGQAIRVKDIAEVRLDLEKRDRINKTNGSPAIGLTVIKKEKADAIRVVDTVRSAVVDFQKQKTALMPFNFTFVDDVSTYIRNRISILSTNMIMGVVLVCATLMLFLPASVALVVSGGIFISFFGTMAYFNVNDHSINLISLLGIIIVSGMLVDDAIVITDNIVRYMEEGLSPQEAAVRGTTEIWPAVLASVLTTVVAFLPMMFMSGIFGKFVKEIPLGVVVALLFSLGESIFLLPQHVVNYVKASHFVIPSNPRGITWVRVKFLSFWDGIVTPWYVNKVRLFVKYRYLTLLGIFVLLGAAGGSGALFLKVVLFPAEGVEIFFIRAKAPTGITLEEASKRIEVVENIVANLPKEELESFVTTVGIQQQEPNDPNTKRGAEYSQVIVYLTPENLRDRVAQDIIEDLRAKIGTPAGYEEVKFERVNPGPPVGKPVSLGVQSDSYEKILPAVQALKQEIAKIEGIRDISDSYTPGKAEIQILPLQASAASAGLSVASIGTTVRAAVDGVVATSIRGLDEEVDVRVMFRDKDKTPSQVISQIQVPNRAGNLVPLLQVAQVKEAQGISLYEHTNNRREVKVNADVNTDVVSSSAANGQIREKILPDFAKRFPEVNVVFGGEDEDTQESMQSLLRAFVVAFAAIFLILIFMFKNLLQPFLVVLTIPLGVTSVLFALIANGQPISFMAMLGIIALSGVIVNNAIVLIDFVNFERARGVGKLESIVEGARKRMRPIFLTTFTTLAGLLPTAHGIGGLDKFVVPIAISLGYGLLFGALLTAFVFPAAIAIVDDAQDWFARKYGA